MCIEVGVFSQKILLPEMVLDIVTMAPETSVLIIQSGKGICWYNKEGMANQGVNIPKARNQLD